MITFEILRLFKILACFAAIIEESYMVFSFSEKSKVAFVYFNKRSTDKKEGEKLSSLDPKVHSTVSASFFSPKKTMLFSGKVQRTVSILSFCYPASHIIPYHIKQYPIKVKNKTRNGRPLEKSAFAKRPLP